MKQIQQFLNAKGYNLTIDGVLGDKSLSAIKEYILNETKDYTLNIKELVWVRTDMNLTNTFDDFVVLLIDKEIKYVAPCSTTAGNFYVKNPITYGGITGTAIAKKQQVIMSHQFISSANWKSLWLGMPYFKQMKAIEIYRDGNKDGKIDTQISTKGIYGINLHHGGLGSIVDRWSAGCQVVPDKYWLEIIKYFKSGEFINFTLI